jgi:hypothetical protein
MPFDHGPLPLPHRLSDRMGVYQTRPVNLFDDGDGAKDATDHDERGENDQDHKARAGRRRDILGLANKLR